MEKEIKNVYIQIGLHTSFNFLAVKMPGKDDKHFSYVRVIDGKIDSERPTMLSLNMEKNVIAFVYDVVEMIGEVIGTKKAGDNTHLKCVTDFSRVDVYIADPEVWNEKKDMLFGK